LIIPLFRLRKPLMKPAIRVTLDKKIELSTTISSFGKLICMMRDKRTSISLTKRPMRFQ